MKAEIILTMNQMGQIEEKVIGAIKVTIQQATVSIASFKRRCPSCDSVPCTC